jgi:hypothetical protein
VDVEDDGRVIGCSVEFFSGERRDRDAVWVDGRNDYTGLTPSMCVEDMDALGWLQPRLPFGPLPVEYF